MEAGVNLPCLTMRGINNRIIKELRYLKQPSRGFLSFFGRVEDKLKIEGDHENSCLVR